MVIAGEDFTHVIDQAAREVGWSSIDEQSKAYEACRGWLTDNRALVEFWLTRPRYNDVDALVYRHLLTYLRGDESEPVDNSGLMYVIAAGNAWDEMPSHMKVQRQPLPIAADNVPADWLISNGIWNGYEAPAWTERG